MSSTVTSKGQVTIPKRVRDRMDIKPGTEVEFSLNEKGEVILVKCGRKRSAKPSPFAKIRGTATGNMTTDEIMALTRGDD